uniref:hypothetical protein n=1 Tax=Klebsormidium elegans TaxID=424407 RepID=UPI00286ABD25|nr:hypothetical protein RMD56_pgp001 [Klebsormidium elegans]WKT06696.1 hypothetical protein [Klebsormidium elegans]
MLERKKNPDTSTSTLSVSSSDADGNKEAGSREFSYFQLKTFCFKYGGGFGILIVLAWYNLFFPLSANAADTSSTRTLSAATQALSKGQKQDQTASWSEIRSSPIALSRTKTVFRYGSSSRRPRLSDSRSLSGTRVRRVTTIQKGLGYLLCVNLNTEKKDTIENRVALQGDVFEAAKTAFGIVERLNEKDVTLIKNFLAMNQNRVTDKNLIPLVWETAAKLTDSTLNTREELEILYPVMKSRLNYLGVEDSEFSKERKYDLLAQEIECTSFLLSYEFDKSDSLVNRTAYDLKQYSGPLNEVPSHVDNELPAQKDWPKVWRDQWNCTFKRIKTATAKDLQEVKEAALGKEFEENNCDLYALAAKVSSLAPFYLVEKSAAAFQLFCDALPGNEDCYTFLKDVLPKANALYQNENLDAYFARRHSACYKALNTEDSASTPLQTLINKKTGQKRPIFTSRDQKGLRYRELEFIREHNPQLFEVPIVSDELFI